MESAGTRRGILVSGDVWRLYSAEDAPPEASFAECELVQLGDPPGIFRRASVSAAALSPAGLAEAIEKGSRDFAVGLGDRLRARVYDKVVRPLSSRSHPSSSVSTTRRGWSELEGVYEATLVILYRLLLRAIRGGQ